MARAAADASAVEWGVVLVRIPPDIQRIEQSIALLKCTKISISCFSGMAVILANHNLLEGAEERT
jgi:hypothetical protein